MSADARTAANAIDAAGLGADIKELSSDAYEGRGPATAGDVKARAWLVQQLKTIGYEPGGVDGSYEQPVDIVGIASKMPKQWSFRGPAGKQPVSLKFGEQYAGVGGLQQPQVSISNAEVVFAGYGIQAPEYQWDDFKGQDLKGKILLLLNNDPDWDDALFLGPVRLYYGRWMYKYESAARQGAAGAIIIHTTPSAGYPWQVVRTSWGGEQFELPAGDEPRLQVKTWVTEDAAAQLAALGGQDLTKLIAAAKSRDFQPVPLGVTTSLRFTSTISKKTTANVAGLLRGSDPQLGREVVIYTAHHDHLGIGEPDKTGDRIYNGAVDNASGVAQVLALARAFKALPAAPRRSVLMLLVAGEEQGLLGSQYYAEHPTFAAGRIAANINFDTANLYGAAADLVFVGKGKSTLDAVVEKYAAVQHRKVKPDQMVDRGFFYRSDQLNFARIGVPAFYMHRAMEFIGKPEGWGKQQYEEYEAQRYHQPSDEFNPDWNYDGIIADTQLAFWVGLDVANADALPAWRPGDEFEAARKAALADREP